MILLRLEICFNPKTPEFGNLGSKFPKTDVGFEISNLKIG